MCNIFSGHIVTDDDKNWGKVLFHTGIHHEEDRGIIGNKYTKLVAWETVTPLDISNIKITHDCGQLIKTKVKKELVLLIESWLKERGSKKLINKSSELKNLESLSLNNTKVVDISALSELKNLKYLYLNNTKVVDMSALSELKSLECRR